MSAGGEPPHPFPCPPLPAAGTALPRRLPRGWGRAGRSRCPVLLTGMPRYVPPPELLPAPGRAVRDPSGEGWEHHSPALRRILWPGAVRQPRVRAAETLRPSECREAVTLRAVPAGWDTRGSAVAPGSVPRPWQGWLCRAHVTCRDVTCQASAGVSV